MVKRKEKRDSRPQASVPDANQKAEAQGKQVKQKDQKIGTKKHKIKYKNKNVGTEIESREGCGKQTEKATEKNQEEKTLERNLEWILKRYENNLPRIWTMDIETDPFSNGTVPSPFVCGLYDGSKFFRFYSDANNSCTQKARLFLQGEETDEPQIIYMHNGGRFDFFYLLDWFEGKATLINSRIVKANFGTWEFRDSYAIMPFPLSAYKKDEIDIEKLSRGKREQYKDEIESYLRGDCVYLWELCMEFHREFGDYLTIASAAFNQLKQRHQFETLPEEQDKEIRSKFFYGGRVQCFKKGVIEQPCLIYDVNSMYPSVMQNYLHPTGWCSLVDTKIRWEGEKLKTFFITVQGVNHGAFPQRTKVGIDFTSMTGIFHVTIHEWLVAMELGLFEPYKILATYNFSDYDYFKTFVQDFYTARKQAKENHDEIRTLFYKYILNSAYGKFAINPENYYNWKITRDANQPDTKQQWELDSFREGIFYVWKVPSKTYSWNYKNVATGASITGAARSVLLSAIAKSSGVIYCDTDSIICSQFAGGDIHDIKLGAWKAEKQGTMAAIAGKKMYAIFDGDKCIKQANKGVSLTPAEIVRICQGENIFTQRDAPTFQRGQTADGLPEAKFISRNVRMT